MKKLFAILPLVLVLVLSMVPAFAEGETGITLNGYCYNPASLINLNDGIELAKCGSTCIPVWFGTLDGCIGNNQGYFDRLNTMNDGKPVGFLNASWGAATPMQLGQAALEQFGLANDWAIPYPAINHVGTVTAKVRVPANSKELKGKEFKLSVDFATLKAAAAAVTDNAGFKKLVEDYGADVVGWSYDEKGENFADFKAKVLDKEATAGTLSKWAAEAEARAKANQMVLVDVKGLYVVVEKANMTVKVNKHIVRGGVEVTVEQFEATIPMNSQLTAATVPAEWAATNYVDVALDAAQTKVEYVPDNSKILTMGQAGPGEWVVDLYFTDAQPSGNANVDAAPANNAAQAAASTLPATGAADTLALSLSAVALIVLGVFFKK